jgi:hypothetical protein
VNDTAQLLAVPVHDPYPFGLAAIRIAFHMVDAIAIYEAPDAITAASVSMTLGASDAASSVETVQLFTMEEAMTAVTKAAQVQKTDRPSTAG